MCSNLNDKSITYFVRYNKKREKLNDSIRFQIYILKSLDVNFLDNLVIYANELHVSISQITCLLSSQEFG